MANDYDEVTFGKFWPEANKTNEIPMDRVTQEHYINPFDDVWFLFTVHKGGKLIQRMANPSVIYSGGD